MIHPVSYIVNLLTHSRLLVELAELSCHAKETSVDPFLMHDLIELFNLSNTTHNHSLRRLVERELRFRRFDSHFNIRHSEAGEKHRFLIPH